jgi:hypothetical protein
MAIANLNVLFKELKGALGKQIVIKQYKYKTKTVIAAYSSPGNNKPSRLQSLYQKDFAKAVKYAQAIINDPVKKKAYAKKIKTGQTVYHFAIAEYKKKYGVKKGK